MNTTTTTTTTIADAYDVIIVGAGLSGICLSYYMKKTTGIGVGGYNFLTIDSRNDIGGMWSELNYPGLRTDTPAPLYQYSFHPLPQSNKYMPTRNEIVSYMNDVVDTYKLRSHMIFNTEVTNANFNTSTGRWTLYTTTTSSSNNNSNDNNTTTSSTIIKEYTCQYYINCVGYFDLYKPYIPKFDGINNFKGTIVHTNQWQNYYENENENSIIDLVNKKIVIVGSGSTTVTIAPAIANMKKEQLKMKMTTKNNHNNNQKIHHHHHHHDDQEEDRQHPVIILQRSPGYIDEAPLYYKRTNLWSIGSFFANNLKPKFVFKPIALLLGKLAFERANYNAIQSSQKRLESQQASWGPIMDDESMDFRQKESQDAILKMKEKYPKTISERHFTPKYYMFEQRQCFAPDGDYFKAIHDGQIQLITGEIDTFTETGIQLKKSTTTNSGNSKESDNGEEEEEVKEKEQVNHHLDADIVILATGLNLSFMSGIQLSIDEQKQDTGKTLAYRGGLMMSGIPNLFNIGGYFKGPYTRRVELQVPFILDIIRYAKANNYNTVTPKLSTTENNPSIDNQIDETPNINFLTSSERHYLTKKMETSKVTASTSSINVNDDNTSENKWRGPNYVQRDSSSSSKPHVGKYKPWRGGWNYAEDCMEFQNNAIPNDGTLEYS